MGLNLKETDVWTLIQTKYGILCGIFVSTLLAMNLNMLTLTFVNSACGELIMNILNTNMWSSLRCFT